MAIFPIRIKPTVDVEKSPSLNKGGFSVSSLIRFRQGLVEAMLGWAAACTQVIGGVARTIHFWTDLSSVSRYAIGTNLQLYLFPSADPPSSPLIPITPTTFVPGNASSGATPYSLLIWSLDNFGENLIACPSGQGLFVWKPSAGGLATPIVGNGQINGGFVTPLVSQFTSITNGGFSISIGGVVQNYTGMNFSAVTDPADISAVIQAVVGGAATVTWTVSPAGQWQFFFIVTNNTLSYASPPLSGGVTDISTLMGWTSATAQLLQPGGDPPSKNQGQFVLDAIQIVLAFGCTPLGSGSQDAMLTRWCAQSDYTEWTASTTNAAGSYRLPHGSRIVGGLQIPSLALLWTDIGLWGVQYIGFPLIFSFQSIGQNCGLIAQHAAVVLGQVIYWMSDHGFFVMAGGGSQQMPCSVWDIVFKNIDNANRDKVIAGTDYHYSEVWWFYPSENGANGEIDSYVKVNIETQSWDYGPAQTGTVGAPGTPNLFSRTAWTDQNQPGYPVSVDLNNLLQQMDQGFTANGAPIGGTIQTGFFDIEDGKAIMSVDLYYPDFLWDGISPSLEMTMLFRSYPDETPTVVGPFTVTPATKYINLRKERTLHIGGLPYTGFPAVRGREVAFEITTVSGWWRWGNNRLRAKPTGQLP